MGALSIGSGTRPVSALVPGRGVLSGPEPGTNDTAFGTPVPLVGVSRRLAEDLASLTDEVGSTRNELETLLLGLIDDVKTIVPSYLGLTMSIGVDGHQLGFTIRADHRPVATSVAIPLRVDAAADARDQLVLYATAPGAFVDLAADLDQILRARGTSVVLDEHLAAPEPSGVTGMHALSVTNRAIGVLVERGMTQQDAQRELGERGAADRLGVVGAAERIVDGDDEPGSRG